MEVGVALLVVDAVGLLVLVALSELEAVMDALQGEGRKGRRSGRERSRR